MNTFKVGEYVRVVGEGTVIVLDYDKDTGHYLVSNVGIGNITEGWTDWFSPYELEKI